MTDMTLVTEVTEAVRQAAKLGPAPEINAESRLVEDLAIDSLDLVGVLLEIQDHFDIVIDDEVVPSLRRIADLAEYIARQHATAVA